MNASPFTRFGFFLGALMMLGTAMPALAATGDTAGTSAVQIEQKGNEGLHSLGKWTLLVPDQSSLVMTTEKFTVDKLKPGRYTLFVEPPQGGSATISHYRNGVKVEEIVRPQISLDLAENEEVRLVIEYKLTRAGGIAVHTDPGGVPFTLSGPNGIKIEGTTPAEFPNFPEGQYSVRYSPPDCDAPPIMSLFLRKDSRLIFDVEITCKTLLESLKKEKEQTKRFVTVTVDGNDVVYTDVPQEAWFAPHVFEMVKTGVLSGYRDASGNPNGFFGPENSVTIGELAKLAHKIAGIDEREAAGVTPSNPKARNAWFSPFMASAEWRDWLVFQDARLDPLRPATRGEIVVTYLQALDVRLRWPTGKAFKDVGRRTKYAAAIETAAADKVISGYTDASGNPTGDFGPGNSVTRAEIAKMSSLFIAKYRESSTSGASSQ
jgi:hypothetical protein